MLSIEVIAGLKASMVNEEGSEADVDLRDLVNYLCTRNDIIHESMDSTIVPAKELVVSLEQWSHGRRIDILGPREVMTYILDKYGISFTVPLVRRKRTRTILDYLCVELVEKAREGVLDPVIGRDSETDACIKILLRRTKSNPCLVGEAGVGKTAIARGIARRIADGTVPRALLSKAVYVLDIATMLENTGIRGSLESKLKEIVTAATRTKDILFIDEIHTIVGGGSGEIANILKPPLADGSISVVGATTLTEYTRYIESDSALERRFLMVEVMEPTIKEAVNILNGLSGLYEKHHNVVIPAGSTDIVTSLSKRYLTSRHLPDSAIDVLDMACVNAIGRTLALGGTTISQEEWRSLVDKRDFLGAALSKPRYRIGKMSDAVLKEEDIEKAVASLSRKKVYISIADQLKAAEGVLHSRIIGQDKPLDELLRLLRTGYIYSGSSSLGAVLLIGTSGCGN